MSDEIPALQFPPRFRIVEDDPPLPASASDCTTPPPGWVFLGKVAVNGQLFCQFRDLQGVLRYVEC